MSALGMASLGTQCANKALGMASLGIICVVKVPRRQLPDAGGYDIRKSDEELFEMVQIVIMSGVLDA